MIYLSIIRLSLKKSFMELKMLKSLTPEVAKIVGKSASILLNQIIYLSKSLGKEKIYRTNRQLISDLEGLFSESTIKRAKKKLVDSGLIQLSFERGINRQSFYSLTEKAKGLSSHIVSEWGKFKNDSTVTEKTEEPNVICKGELVEVMTKEELDSEIKSKDNWYSGWNKKEVTSKKQDYMPSSHSKKMKESFKKGFSNPNGKPMPEKIKNMFLRKKKKHIDVVTENKNSASIDPIISCSLQNKNSLSFDSVYELDALNDYNQDLRSTPCI